MAVPGNPVHQLGEFLFFQCGFGCHHDDAAALGILHGRLQCGFDAENRQLRVFFPDQMDGGAGSGIAGKDDGFDIPAKQIIDSIKGQLLDFSQRS
ncbi:hypothetical protein SDC9_169551 [bioreactor metagenome]|uniref:Uncharacterized protein n=1 Tax=bioreactor metagenome TaxID=1076179 RepID=A0A645G5N0_9ZZZZ